MPRAHPRDAAFADRRVSVRPYLLISASPDPWLDAVAMTPVFPRIPFHSELKPLPICARFDSGCDRIDELPA
jgi:hypothetical protein